MTMTMTPVKCPTCAAEDQWAVAYPTRSIQTAAIRRVEDDGETELQVDFLPGSAAIDPVYTDENSPVIVCRACGWEGVEKDLI